MKVAMVEMNPMNRLKHMTATNAVLGTANKKEAGYISGMIDQLKIETVTSLGRPVNNKKRRGISVVFFFRDYSTCA